MLPRMVETPRTAAPRAGHLLIIGGAEDKLRQRQILSRFVNLAGGHDAKVVVISTASSLGDEATELYRSLFHAMGVAEVSGIRPLSREEANDPRLSDLLEGATGIFMTGGNQLRLASVIVLPLFPLELQLPVAAKVTGLVEPPPIALTVNGASP